MGNESSAQAVATTYETPMTYEDFYRSHGNSGTVLNWLGYGDNFFAKVGNIFSGNKSRMENAYNNYVSQINKLNEERAIENARRYNEWFEGTKYQRAVDDLKKAGLNPWLALNSGFGTSQAASIGNSSAKGVEYELKEKQSSGLAAVLGAIAKMLS